MEFSTSDASLSEVHASLSGINLGGICTSASQKQTIRGDIRITNYKETDRTSFYSSTEQNFHIPSNVNQNNSSMCFRFLYQNVTNKTV